MSKPEANSPLFNFNLYVPKHQSASKHIKKRGKTPQSVEKNQLHGILEEYETQDRNHAFKEKADTLNTEPTKYYNNMD